MVPFLVVGVLTTLSLLLVVPALARNTFTHDHSLKGHGIYVLLTTPSVLINYFAIAMETGFISFLYTNLEEYLTVQVRLQLITQYFFC